MFLPRHAAACRPGTQATAPGRSAGMAAESAPRPGGEAFARPAQMHQRRYEAVRAYLYEGAPLGEAAARFGYTRSALASLVRDFRAGKLALFAEQGSPGRDTHLPRAAVIDFAGWPGRLDTRLAGLLLTVPDLVTLDLPGLARTAGYPGTAAIPPASRILSLLALKLTATRRVSHVDDLLTDPASALFAGLSILPKKSALTDYSYRLSHDHQRRFLAALDAILFTAAPAT